MAFSLFMSVHFVIFMNCFGSGWYVFHLFFAKKFLPLILFLLSPSNLCNHPCKYMFDIQEYYFLIGNGIFDRRLRQMLLAHWTCWDLPNELEPGLETSVCIFILWEPYPQHWNKNRCKASLNIGPILLQF